MRNLLPPPLFVLSAGLCIALTVLAARGRPSYPAAVAAPKAADPVLAPASVAAAALFLPSPQDRRLRLQAVKERPLFTASRRLPAPELETAAAEETPKVEEKALFEPETDSAPQEPAAAPPELVYLGILAQEQNQMALVRLLSGGAEIWVRAGEQIEGWTVAEVTNSQLILQLNDERHIVELIR